MAPALTRRLREALPTRTEIYVMYGQTEASARLAYVPPDRLLAKLGSIGVPIPGVELTLRRADGEVCDEGEVGEIVATGPNIMQGYWNDPEETALVLFPDGLHTGDLARRDGDGFLFIVDRMKNMIKVGANRVSAKEIEETVAEVPGVVEVCVVGVEDELLGEAVEAFVVSANGPTDERRILKHLRENLALYKIPRTLRFIDAMPRTGAGKIDKPALRARL
jgi:acyl-CoA synthetase (AMP-forming)/AMP-acid ligase II